jgi:NAD(P)-dependent dehydrogenase (short-subunit alcohol dehydrogenase family)
MEKAVLVTGASSGIGRKITERLAAKGCFVYATARKDADLERLAAIANVQPIRLDVTRPAEVAAALDVIAGAGRGLHGLVNNAGIATMDTIADMKFEELELVMAVNAHGPVRMTKAFLPLIAAQSGRIVTIGSISGILAGPGLAAYAMSKHAVEALTDSLAEQLTPLGVGVSVVEPGNYNSHIIRNAVARERIVARPATVDQSTYPEPDAVAMAVEHALLDPSPKRRYLVVPTQDQAERTIRKQIEQLVQLNEGHPHSFDRAKLVAMLDEALATARPGSGTSAAG